MLSELSIDSLGFDRLWFIRSIFSVMVLGSMLMIIDRSLLGSIFIPCRNDRSISLGLVDRG
jgi:hypothetical protein